ncbi:MAG: DDE transposase [bacterium (Candidatus Ratteibacteria) CG_4_10_14_3_um_filter_41_18]|uniref:DDE transposase n=4 Tax=Candidatus Ratteibacteria TaxID=2979319 RepID=A0A2M7YF18_9BACT|nr:MAG: DDE transposase [bacterium (Candidatus Ratteibacteria) CG01_land_8_20_14_3_00_40_19]PIW34042.1 MAG: DDE transposase [bacterium (Candidatus Ratteibacteria) CG15_BIG_FIL_POST_REV_8_21_14_020_41_12]PIX77124.1 MAG: DDE transposase [bacterium (Candidatus Ratteibacteria) CG_4_10_14_3_um_filter_41_18]PJA61574.1 MAG: DDE transposase [bacterium (Candidatus Ratteibacteria) CG_4_9_14_3_um_filter_41_21]HCG76803.1 DDE transposase [bacterium]
MSQKYLFSLENLIDVNPLKEYHKFFSNLELDRFFKAASSVGRKPVSPINLIKALIFKNLKGIPSLAELVRELEENPSLAIFCGFEPGSAIPPRERFSAFLRNTPNEEFQRLRRSLVKKLILLGEIKGTYLSIDSAPIKSKVKENNLKASYSNRFDKSTPPKGDPEARIGIEIHFLLKKQVSYFWGYRNYCVTDSESELPVEEITRAANTPEVSMFIPLFSRVQNYRFSIKGILADANFDSESILKYIFEELKAYPYIARNPRRRTNQEYQLSSSGARVCIAGFEMVYWGKFRDRGKERLKFVCPITHSKSFQKEHPYCPWFHPRFVEGKGCVAYLRADSNIREKIAYQSKKFKKIYSLRTGTERLFSRLLSLTMQNLPVKGLNAVANHCTLAHITCLGIALAACKTGHRDKIRYVKTFLPNLYKIVKEQNL